MGVIVSITSRYKEAIVAGTLEVVTNIKASDELERIRMWLRFDSVDSSQRMSSLLNDRAEGTGLWLFENKTFVKFLEGQIKVLSIQGKGTMTGTSKFLVLTLFFFFFFLVDAFG